MKARGFLWIVSVILMSAIFAVTGIWSASPVKAETINLTYANFPPAPTFPCVQMEEWKKLVEKRTNGKVKIKTFPGGSLIKAKPMFDEVSKGVADIGCLATSYSPGRFPICEVMEMPFMYPSGAVASAVMWDLVKKHNPKSFKDVKIITVFTCATAQILSSKPVKKLADLKGLKLRTTGFGRKTMDILGASAIPMPQSRVPENLQKGVLQGNVTSMEVLKDMKLFEYCPNTTMTNIWVIPFAVVMNKKKWESLPDDVKKVIDDMSRDHAIWTGKYVDKHAQDVKKWCIENKKVEFTDLTKEQKADWEKRVASVVEDYLKAMKKKSLPGDAVLKDAKELTAKNAKELK
ncbi:TRAP transporter substrate-binding protein [Thermodesulfobacteriota bacterium]